MKITAGNQNITKNDKLHKNQRYEKNDGKKDAAFRSNTASHVAESAVNTCCFDGIISKPILRFFRRLMTGCCARRNRMELGVTEQRQDPPNVAENLRGPFKVSMKFCDYHIVGSLLSSESFMKLDQLNKKKLWLEILQKEDDYNRQRLLLNSRLNQLVIEHRAAEDTLQEQKDLIFQKAYYMLGMSLSSSSRNTT